MVCVRFRPKKTSISLTLSHFTRKLKGAHSTEVPGHPTQEVSPIGDLRDLAGTAIA